MSEKKMAAVAQEDVFVDMVNQAVKARPRRVGYFVSEADWKRLQRYDREARMEQELAPLQGWKTSLLRIAGGTGRAAASLIFIAGAADGFMDPVFAMVLSGISVLWGASYILWGKRYG